jgi:hypothetical protein
MRCNRQGHPTTPELPQGLACLLIDNPSRPWLAVRIVNGGAEARMVAWARVG